MSRSTRRRNWSSAIKVDFVVGPIFSNILMAIVKPVTDAGKILDQPQCRHLDAGRQRAATRTSSSPPTRMTRSIEVLGQYAQDQGYKKRLPAGAELSGGQGLARRLQALLQGRGGRRGLHAARPGRFLRRTGADRRRRSPMRSSPSCPAAWASIWSSNIARPASPTIPFLSAFTVDEITLPAQQDAALGFFGGANWAPNMDNPQSKEFVAAYEKTYGSVPGTYAMQCL